MASLLSIILASNKADQFSGFLDNLQETCADPNCFEVLVKIDAEDGEMIRRLEQEVSRRPFAIRYIATARDGGYYTLHRSYQTLLQMSDPDTYFTCVFTDEIRIRTPGWDRILAGYVGLFSDNVFRLKISENKNRNYYAMADACPCPENYSIATKEWYRLSEGFGDFWGPDSWHQCIEYYMGQCLAPGHVQGIFRGIAINDIVIGGEEAGVGWAGPEAFERARRISEAWKKMNTFQAHQRFLRLATRMAAHIWAHHLGHPDYRLMENRRRRVMSIFASSETDRPLMAFPYRLPRKVYLRERAPRLLNLHRRGWRNWVWDVGHKLPLPLARGLERVIRSLLWPAAYGWGWSRAKSAWTVVENTEFKQILIVNPENGFPYRSFCYRLR